MKLQILYCPEHAENMAEEVAMLKRTIADLTRQLMNTQVKLNYYLKWVEINQNDIDREAVATGDPTDAVAKTFLNGKNIYIKKNEIKDIRIVDGEKKFKTNFQIWNKIEKSKQEKEKQIQERRKEYAIACLDGGVVEYNINDK